MGDKSQHALLSTNWLVDREIMSHLLRINTTAVRLVSYLRIYEILALSQTQRGLPLVARAEVRSRRRAIYVLGGSDGRGLAGAGLRLDPAAGAWEPLPEMRRPRASGAGGSIVGRLFVCGGSDGQASLRSVECFNPGTMRWEAAPPMLQARSGAAAVPVGGNLIVCGGKDGANYLNSVERFVPRQMEGMFSGKAGMSSFFMKAVFGTKFKWRVSTFCRGMVVPARDYAHEKAIMRSWPFTVTPNTRIELTTQGGVGAQESVAGLPATVEGMTSKEGFLGVAIRDIATDTWIVSKRRSFSGGSTWKEGRDPENDEGGGHEESLFFEPHELLELDGREITVDVVDTYNGNMGWISVRRVVVSGVETAGAWEALPPMASSRCHAAGGKLPGHLYVCGGIDAPTRTFSSVERFDPLAEEGAGLWEHAMPMSVPRSSAGCATALGCLYVCGGHDGNLELPTIERLSAASGQWEVLATMSVRRRFPGAAAIAGKLFVFGGLDGKRYLENGERFDERRWQWEGLTTAMPEGRALAMVAAGDC